MMKRLPRLFFTLTLILPLFVPAQNNRESVRINKLFNFDWKFQPGNIPDAQAVNYDDKTWRNLDLPHDFQIEQPWDQSRQQAKCIYLHQCRRSRIAGQRKNHRRPEKQHRQYQPQEYYLLAKRAL